MIEIGLVGFGFAGRVFHAPITSAVPGLKLRAILQRSGEDAATLYPQAQVVKSMDELLGIHEIRLVVIATPNIPITRLPGNACWRTETW
jgi:scyllo-inositol 2-dehydrogenase (NADP+)